MYPYTDRRLRPHGPPLRWGFQPRNLFPIFPPTKNNNPKTKTAGPSRNRRCSKQFRAFYPPAPLSVFSKLYQLWSTSRERTSGFERLGLSTKNLICCPTFLIIFLHLKVKFQFNLTSITISHFSFSSSPLSIFSTFSSHLPSTQQIWIVELGLPIPISTNFSIYLQELAVSDSMSSFNFLYKFSEIYQNLSSPSTFTLS